MAGARGLSDRVADSILNELAGVGVVITDIGRLREGHVIKEFTWIERCSILGEEHPDTISAMSNLVSTLGDLGSSTRRQR
jgi:hypothetical protein